MKETKGNEPKRVFIFKKEATYIEKQEITVEAGAVLNIGSTSKPEEHKDNFKEILTTDSSEELTDASDTDPLRPLPDCLSTPEAMVIWRRLQEAGMVDKWYQPDVVYHWQKVLLANAIAERLGIKNKWQVFESFWGVSGMKQEFQRARKNAGYEKFIKKLERIGV